MNAQPRQRTLRGGVVVPHAARWYQRAGGWLVYALVRGVAATLRYRWEDRSGVLGGARGEPVIVCTWHNRLALCLPVYVGYARPGGTGRLAAMVSASKDGAFLATILECFGVQPVRGSSSRRGSQALLELTTWAERGYDLALTPDGPRGPRYVVQQGITSLAQVTGLPIVPCSYWVPWKIQINSWDGFQIPLPFSRCDMVAGPAIRVPREATEDEREELRRQLETSLRGITRD